MALIKDLSNHQLTLQWLTPFPGLSLPLRGTGKRENWEQGCQGELRLLLKEDVGCPKGGFPLSRNFYVRTCVKFTFARNRERPRSLNFKSERDTSYLASFFIYKSKIYVRVHASKNYATEEIHPKFFSKSMLVLESLLKFD